MKPAMIALLAAFAFAAGAPAQAGPADEAQIRGLLERWAKAFHDRDITGIMAMYEPSEALVAYDIVPPLKYQGYAAYKKDYETFLAQYKGPVDIEYRDIRVVAGTDVAYAYGLERISGTLTNGQASTMWVRFTSGFRKIGGRWFDTHDHISVPTDMDTGKARLDLSP